jgi:hypothetical protein
MIKMFFKKNKKEEKERGFVILIAIIVSSLLVSMGMFIASIAYKELQLSTSTKASQTAFYVTDSVMECALRADIRDDIFGKADYGYIGRSAIFLCNGIKFKSISVYPAAPKIEIKCSDDPNDKSSGCYSGKFVYYVSFAGDENSDKSLSKYEIKNNPKSAYARVIFHKTDIGRNNSKTTIEVSGHNNYFGSGIVERAMSVSY